MRIITVSDLYAALNGNKNRGDWSCHWCSSPCEDFHIHDEPPPVPFVKRSNLAKNPPGIYVCNGCWFWRMPSITVFYLKEQSELKDRQRACNHSWYITPERAWVIDHRDCSLLYDKLLRPPLQFCLSFLDQGQNDLAENHIQFSILNNHKQIAGNTPLFFTVNNTTYQYTIHELRDALQNANASTEPGVRYLCDLLHKEASGKVKKEKGRPKKEGDSVLPGNVLVSAESGAFHTDLEKMMEYTGLASGQLHPQVIKALEGHNPKSIYD